MVVRILTGDCRDVLATLPDESVHCVVTSPPYWGLRDYGTAQWDGGDPGCEHVPDAETLERQNGRASTLAGTTTHQKQAAIARTKCKCGARRIDSQLGLEPTLAEYIATMVGVFREVRRVLRKDGTCWVNMGDCYASSVNGRPAAEIVNDDRTFRDKPFSTVGNGLKPKDLCGVPWRLAFALQEDGWWLRQDIIWAKPNPMPESVTDRCTKAHEYLFLLSKSASYYYDAEAIKEEASWQRENNPEWQYQRAATNEQKHPTNRNGKSGGFSKWDAATGRNRRSVWEIATAPFPEAHFATFPPALVEPCIKAGTSERGCCAKCGAPWERQIERVSTCKSYAVGKSDNKRGQGLATAFSGYDDGSSSPSFKTTGWSPCCSCKAGVVPATVLDCFGGAGTVGLVADRLQRNAILVELNPTYAAMGRRRIHDDAPLFVEAAEYAGRKDFSGSVDDCYRAVRERVANGGPAWTPK